MIIIAIYDYDHRYHQVHDMTTDELLEAFPVTEITPQGDEVPFTNVHVDAKAFFTNVHVDAKVPFTDVPVDAKACFTNVPVTNNL